MELYTTRMAARNGQKDMVEWLLVKGAKPENAPWALPLTWAERRGYKEIVKLLKQHAANKHKH